MAEPKALSLWDRSSNTHWNYYSCKCHCPDGGILADSLWTLSHMNYISSWGTQVVVKYKFLAPICTQRVWTLVPQHWFHAEAFPLWVTSSPPAEQGAWLRAVLDCHTGLSCSSRCGDPICTLKRDIVTLEKVPGWGKGVRLNLCFHSALNVTQMSPKIRQNCKRVISR